MPELPEVEHLRRSLCAILPGRRVDSVRLHRPDVVRVDSSRRRAARSPDLLRGAVITGVLRHGKQLAITSDSGRALCIHLGMSGQLVCLSHDDPPLRQDHIHVEWRLAPASDAAPGPCRMLFRDPRRFGGVWAFLSHESLVAARWSVLGPDAAAVTTDQLAAALRRTNRSLKAALLDQALLAGLGNIYVDEALFLAGLHPERPAPSLSATSLDRLHAAIHATLARAIDAGGSSLRDYVDATGRPGGFQRLHAVYGRAGQPCQSCGAVLSTSPVAQRTTVWCARCQR